jgi:hypothetical protein
MRRFDGTLALNFDFGELTTTTFRGVRVARADLRLAQGESGERRESRVRLMGPDKYKVLEHRRRQAQIAARRQLDLI